MQIIQNGNSNKDISPVKKSLDPQHKYRQASAFLNRKSEVEGDISLESIQPLAFNLIRAIIGVLLSSLLGLIPVVLSRWSIRIRRLLFFDLLPKQEFCKASHYLIRFSDNSLEIESVLQLQPQRDTIFSKYETIGFRSRKIMYVYNSETTDFEALESTIFKDLTIENIYKQYGLGVSSSEIKLKGLTKSEVNNRLKIFGKCLIEIDYKNILVYVMEEMTQPLYFIQILAVIIWILQDYYVFGGLTLGISVLIQMVNYIFYRNSMIKLKEKAHTIINVKVFRESSQTNIELQTVVDQVNINQQTCLIQPQMQSITSDNLVPGDLILLQDNMAIPCDCILLSGEIFVNEVSLTGESIPVPKYEIDMTEQYYKIDQKLNTKSYLFEGTTVQKLKQLIALKIPALQLFSEQATQPSKAKYLEV